MAQQEESPAAVAQQYPSSAETGDVDAIRRAPDPSAAVAAYARARAANPDTPAVERVYVRRMVELGVPEMAAAQARALTQADPHDGLAWAVVAEVSARRGRPVAALADLPQAVQYAPSEPFVQQVAGQLLAWLDAEGSGVQVTSEVKQALESTRTQLGGDTIYVQAYGRAQ